MLAIPTTKTTTPRALIFDLETLPTADPEQIEQIRTEAYTKEPAHNTLKALKDAWHTSDAKEARFQTALSRTALDPTRGRIACICAATDHLEGVTRVDLMRQPLDDGLNEFAAWCEDTLTDETVWCGHNSNGFDLPFLAFAFARYRVQPPRHFPTHYNGRIHGRTYDTMLAMATSGAPFISLKDSLTRTGLGLRKGAPSGMSPEREIDGSMVYALYLEGNYDLILDYCANDVRIQRELVALLTHNYTTGPFRRDPLAQEIDDIVHHPTLTHDQKILTLYPLLSSTGAVPKIPY